MPLGSELQEKASARILVRDIPVQAIVSLGLAWSLIRHVMEKAYTMRKEK